MPYYDDEEDQNNSNMNVLDPSQQGQTQEQDPSISGASVSGGAPVSAPSATKPKKGVGSGTFTPFKKYLEANKSKGTQLAGAVTGKTQERASQIGDQVAQQQKTYQQRVAEQRARSTQAQKNVAGQIQQAATLKAGETLTPEQITQSREFISGETEYDRGAFSLAQQQNKARQLALQTQQAGTEQGRRGLLQSAFGGGQERYTRGQSALDQLILQSSPEAREAITQQTVGASEGLQKSIADARREALSQTGQLGVDIKSDRDALTGQITTAEDALSSDIEASRIAEQTKRQDYLDRVTTASGADQFGLSSQDLANLGLAGGDYLYGVDPTKFLGLQDDVTSSQVATQDQLARAQALASLTGSEGGYQDIISNVGRVGEATEFGGLTGSADLKEAIRVAKEKAAGEVSGEMASTRAHLANMEAQKLNTYQLSGRDTDKTYTPEEQRILGARGNFLESQGVSGNSVPNQLYQAYNFIQELEQPQYAGYTTEEKSKILGIAPQFYEEIKSGGATQRSVQSGSYQEALEAARRGKQIGEI